MRSHAARRLSALIAFAAMLGAQALPAAAVPKVATFGDLCVGGKLVPAAPAGHDATSHDCDACCASTPPALRSPRVSQGVAPYAPARAAAHRDDVPRHIDAIVARARAPPVP